MPADLVHLVRHGEVDNPGGVLYGRIPGFGLSELGHRMAEAAAACGAKQEPGEGAGGSAREDLRLVLDYFPNADHAGIYAAQAAGDFKDVGLDLKIRQPADPAAPIKQVAAGRVDLAVLDRVGRAATAAGEDPHLVALAGERLHPPGWTEISAVCTDPAFRGQGLATRLVRAVAHGIRERGETPLMHAAAENETAIRLYLALGFSLRVHRTFAVLRTPS